MKREVTIDNFIATYDGYILPEECDKAINLFENQQKFNKTITRAASEKAPNTIKKIVNISLTLAI